VFCSKGQKGGGLQKNKRLQEKEWKREEKVSEKGKGGWVCRMEIAAEGRAEDNKGKGGDGGSAIKVGLRTCGGKGQTKHGGGSDERHWKLGELKNANHAVDKDHWLSRPPEGKR